MYDILYYLVLHHEHKDFNKSYCTYKLQSYLTIREKLLLITVEKRDIQKYLYHNKIKDNYEIREVRLNDYIDLYKNLNIYIIFNQILNKDLSSKGIIKIVNIAYDYDTMIKLIKGKYYFSALKYFIYKLDDNIKIDNIEYPLTSIYLAYDNIKYHTQRFYYNELPHRPKLEFLYVNEMIWMFTDETYIDYNLRLVKRKLYDCQIKIIEGDKKKKNIEEEKIRELKIIETREKDIRVKKFMSLSKDSQNDVIKFFEL